MHFGWGWVGASEYHFSSWLVSHLRQTNKNSQINSKDFSLPRSWNDLCKYVCWFLRLFFVCSFVCLFVCFLSCPWHVKVPRPGIKSGPQQQPEPQQRQCQILNTLYHQGTPVCVCFHCMSMWHYFLLIVLFILPLSFHQIANKSMWNSWFIFLTLSKDITVYKIE